MKFLNSVFRYTAENSVKFRAPRDTGHPERRQSLAPEIWESILKTLDSGSKISLLTNGPLTNLAKLILSNKKASSLIEVSRIKRTLSDALKYCKKRNSKHEMCFLLGKQENRTQKNLLDNIHILM